MPDIVTGLDLKVVTAMHRIEKLYYDTAGNCYLSFSGGKDSTVILALIKMCEDLGTIPPNAIPALFADTKIELDATYKFVKWCKENYYENIIILTPDTHFAQILKDYGKPIKSKLRSKLLNMFHRNPNMKSVKALFDKAYIRSALANKDMHLIHPNMDIKFSAQCCTELKKKPFKKYAKEHDIGGYFTGERLAEGGIRSVNISRRINSGKNVCTRISNGYTIVQPIVDWSDDIVDKFIKKYNVPLSDAYTKYGMERTGCVCCPFSKNLAADLQTIKEYEPNKYKASIFWLKDVYIAQNVELPFDEEYEKERKEKWENDYEFMRYEMLKEHRPDCRICKSYEKRRQNNG